MLSMDVVVLFTIFLGAVILILFWALYENDIIELIKVLKWVYIDEPREKKLKIEEE